MFGELDRAAPGAVAMEETAFEHRMTFHALAGSEKGSNLFA